MRGITSKTQLEVYGLLSDIRYQVARCCAEDLLEKYPDQFNKPIIVGMLEFQWNEFLAEKRRSLKGETWVFEANAMIFCDKEMLGGPTEFIQWAEAKHNYEMFRPIPLYQTFAEQQYKEYMNKHGRTHCFLEISIDKEPAGRLLIELFSDKVPKTSENFKQLCSGENGKSETSDYPLHYKNTLMHRIVPNGWIQAGDIWPPHKGNGGESVYGPVFEDESFQVKHDRRGIIGMSNKGRHTNGSQFYICLQPTPWMDTKYVAFGQVVEGTETLAKIEKVHTFNERPMVDIRITDCGVVNYDF